MSDFAAWYENTLPENRDAMNMLRRALEKNWQFALCIEASSSTLCLNNCDDSKTLARMLERFARKERSSE